MGQSRVTRAVPRQRGPKTPPRWGIVYGFNILDPATMQVRVDYVGQTMQTLGARERQHRGDDWSTDATEQPWSDLIVGKPFVIEQGLWSCAELDEREAFHIRRLMPRYNYTHNLANPGRIPIPVARRQREGRDRARGVVSPVWDSAPRVRMVRPRREPVPVRRRWSRRQRRVAMLAALWLVLAVAGWWASVHWAGLAVAGGAKAGVFTACAVFVVAWVNRRPRRRRR